MTEFDPIDALRPHIRDLPSYEAIADSTAIAKKYGIEKKDILRLDGNENPFGASPLALQALRSEYEAERYTDANQTLLREALQDFLNVPSETIVAGAGSDELIDLIYRMWIQPGDRIITCGPTFGMYAFDAAIYQAEFVDVNRKTDWSIDEEALLREAENAKLVILATPNNPTGNSLQPSLVEKLLKTNALIVLDEAYIEFSQSSSMVNVACSHPSLIVLRTFSKWAGLAGLRIGYAVAHRRIIDAFMKTKQPYNVSAPSVAAAIASLKDIGELDRRASMLTAERDRVFSTLEKISWLKPFQSETNFLLVRTVDRDAKEISDKLRREGIFIRTYSEDNIKDCIRISMGTSLQNDRVIEALSNIER